MARQKSVLLSNLGIAFNIFKALVDAALRARVEDDEALLRQLEEDDVADAVIADLVERAGLPKPQPNLEGLTEVQYVEVDYDNPQFQRIDPTQYAYCNETARTGDFPLRHKCGKYKVGYAWIPRHYFDHNPSNEEIIDETDRRHLIRPDRAVSETVFSTVKDDLAENPSIAVWGVVQSDTRGGQIVGCVHEGRVGRSCDQKSLHYGWGRSSRFLVVVSEERI